MTRGHVYLVGAGPGDPGLITVAGAAALAQADVVLYDALSSPALLRSVPAHAERCYVGKRASQHALSQDEMNALLVQHARAGRIVVRLKGGDPFVFGRGSEEALACREAGVPFTVVPGITSAIAAPAYAGIPVTHRGLSAGFYVVTGNEAAPGTDAAEVDWEAAARADTVVILMGVRTLAGIAEKLVSAGKSADTPVACVRWGTRPDQQVVSGTLSDIAERAAEVGLKAPVVTVVGPVAGLGPQLEWFRPGPLTGRSIVVTRARSQSSELVGRLEALGAYVVEAPAIRVTLDPAAPRLREGLSRATGWLVLTSANAVQSVIAALDADGRDVRALAGFRIAAIGSATDDALRAHGLRADFLPSRATADALGAELPLGEGEAVLYPASSLADERLESALRTRGAAVTRVDAYTTRPDDLDEERKREVYEADAVTFTSASTAQNLRNAVGHGDLPAAKLISIGPQTSEAVRAAFGRVDAEAATPGLEALVEALLATLEARS